MVLRGVGRFDGRKACVPSVVVSAHTQAGLGTVRWGEEEGVSKDFLHPTSCLCCPFSSVPGKLAHGVCCGGPQCSWRKILRRLLRNSDPGQGCQTVWGRKEFRKLGNGCCCYTICQAQVGSGRGDDCRSVCRGVRPGIWIPTGSISLHCP